METARHAPYHRGARGENKMPSYYISRRPQADGTHVLHERDKCPPDCFPAKEDAEYLGELLDGFQAIALARLNYRHVNGCLWCATEVHELGTEAEVAWPGAKGAAGQGARRMPATLA
jgi:hypothetical protein